MTTALLKKKGGGGLSLASTNDNNVKTILVHADSRKTTKNAITHARPVVSDLTNSYNNV